MKLRRIALATLVSAVGIHCALAHENDLRSSDLKPRIGQISDEVAAQRVKSLGIENARVVGRTGQTILIEGVENGHTIRLRMDALRGRPSYERENWRPTTQAPPVSRPSILGPQTSAQREKLSDPALMRNAVQGGP